MFRSLSVLAPTLAMLGICASCGSSGITSISGQATVDAAPIEVGSISVTPADAPGSRGAGGPITDGRFEVTATEALQPGSYTVQVQASKKTGRTVKDPQRGEVEEIIPLVIADSPKQVDISSENASSLQLDFTTRKN